MLIVRSRDRFNHPKQKIIITVLTELELLYSVLPSQYSYHI